MAEVTAQPTPANVLSTPPFSPSKKRKGTPFRSPKPTIDQGNSLTAVYISFPFTFDQDDQADSANKHPSSFTTSPQVSALDAPPLFSHAPSLEKEPPKFSPPFQPTRLSSLGSTVITSGCPSAPPKAATNANVRFVGDSFYGSNKFWWTRCVRPSPVASSSSSDSDTNGDDKDEDESGKDASGGNGNGGNREGSPPRRGDEKHLGVHAGLRQEPLLSAATTSNDNQPMLPTEWEALGPFAMGARELGVDPLSAYGGFETIPYSETDRYPSELADEGYVQWFKATTNEDQSVGPVDFSNIRWEFNQDPFGWTSLHHAIYFRGTFQVPRSGVYIVNFNHVVSYKIDNKAYVGNVYGYSHSSGTPMYLERGDHMLYICAVMDVRLFGGQVPPKVLFTGKFLPVDQETPSRNIILFNEDAIIPEVLDGKLVTPFFSLTIMNTFVAPSDSRAVKATRNSSSIMDSEIYASERQESSSALLDDFGNPTLGHQEMNGEPGWVQILDIRAVSSDGTKLTAEIPVLFSLKLAPGQIYPLPVDVDFEAEEANGAVLSSIHFEIEMYDLDRRDRFLVKSAEFPIRARTWGDTYKITFLDYDNVVHYVLELKQRAPSGQRHTKDKIMLGGFDWHGPSNLNVESAIHALSHLHGVPPLIAEQLGIDPNKLVYSGHSNGGQGAWWMSSHYPDRALAAMPASGYLKIQFYTPYYMRVGDAYTDPIFRAIMESSIAENDIDMYAANMAGIPILARTGGNDDNVPPLNTRRIVRLVNEWNRDPNSVHISEVYGQGHWFTGIMNDDILSTFLDKNLDPTLNPGLPHPPLPDAFTISTLNPGSTGSKGGIKILQLEVPFRLAQIRVHREGNHWVLNTINVRRFGFLKDERAKIDTWEIDGMKFNEPPKVGPSYLRKDDETEWKLVPDLLWISEERYWSTYGPAVQILNHPFLIVVPSNPITISSETYHRNAQLIATSWYLYGRGGTQIIRDIDVRDGIAAKYHLIVLGGPKDNLFTRRREKEGGAEGNAKLVKFLESGGFQIDTKKYEAPGTGMLFLAPSPTRTLMGMYITGIDELGFKRAVWTIPFRTGLMVPDYLVVGDEYGDPATGWTAGDGNPYGGAGTKGTGGIFAAGYWSNLMSTTALLTLLAATASVQAIWTTDADNLIEAFQSLVNTPFNRNSDVCNYSDIIGNHVTCTPSPENRIIAVQLTGLGIQGSPDFYAMGGGLSQLTALQYLNISSNAFSGFVPDSIFASNVPEVDVSYNCFTGTTITPIPSVYNFAPQSTGCAGPLFEGPMPYQPSSTPYSLQCQDLQSGFPSLNFGPNCCAWNPTRIGCSNGDIVSLDLSNLGLAGSIPNVFARFHKLTSVDLSGNSFTGSLPSSLEFIANGNWFPPQYESDGVTFKTVTSTITYPGGTTTATVVQTPSINLATV
ncbi:UNVERIFIED_CONTAM: hypothetical protein HDU68_002701 [Siphonaria sp. JEL0065]|nr:hypothetical protein HDU68_002701 [Siphonaria sp. JEL0065]